LETQKILVVDDSKLMHKMYEVMLRQHQLLHAHDGREALDVLKEHSDTRLVFLDINMPHMNGLEFLAEAKQDATLAGIPVVIVSTEGKEEDTQRGLEAGAAAYIRKPFRNAEINEIISRLAKGSAA
jgi:two-component system, chemotaxis family, chemotaxis protein CheY